MQLQQAPGRGWRYLVEETLRKKKFKERDNLDSRCMGLLIPYSVQLTGRGACGTLRPGLKRTANSAREQLFKEQGV